MNHPVGHIVSTSTNEKPSRRAWVSNARLNIFFVRATDPALGIEWPSDHPVVLSDRDAEAPTLDEVRATGLLPTWDEARAFVEELRNS